ncbi:MAG: SH3 domain-containing protein [Sandaracinaceae bacterium]
MRSAWAAGVAAALLAWATPSGPVQAQGGTGEEPLAPGVYARVIVDRTALRSGPGVGFQRIRIAERGETFKVLQRARRGYWFQVELPDGTRPWIQGDAVYNHEVTAEEATGGRFLPKLFAPPPLPSATGELAVMLGVLGLSQPGAFMAFRPTFYLAPEVGIELDLAGSLSDRGRFWIGGGGPVINVFPESPIVPFFTVGGGFVVSDPNADTFLLDSGVLAVMYGGGGLRLGFRYRITLRLEARGYAFFDENRIVGLEEFSGGLTVFF